MKKALSIASLGLAFAAACAWNWGGPVYPKPQDQLRAATWFPPEPRGTTWAPGIPGGIPSGTVHATLPAGASASTINAAIQAAGATADSSGQIQVVQLSAGAYNISEPLTTDLNPWIELSYDLDATQLNNFKNVSASNGGMSVTGVMR